MLRRHNAFIVEADAAANGLSVVFVFTGAPPKTRFVREVAAEAAPAAAAAPAAEAAPAAAAAPAAPAAPAAAAPAPIAKPTADKQQQPAPADDIGNYTYFIRDRVIILFRNVSYDGVDINVTDISVTEHSENQINVVLLSARPDDEIAFNITGESGYWQVDTFSFRGEILTPYEFQISALDDFSWHCSPSLLFQLKTGKLAPLHLSGLQLEPIFGKLEDNEPRKKAFSDSWDCVGFTSGGIWGGLFVTLLMLVILSIGMSWIMDIRTMDRFDDPKGKTIIVGTAE